MEWFDPTDVIQIHPGEIPLNAAQQTGLIQFIESQAYLKSFLRFNQLRLRDLFLASECTRKLYHHHLGLKADELQGFPKDPHLNRSYSFFLDSLDHLGEAEISLLHTKSSIAILEIGFGNGRMLLDMAEQFTHSTVTGIAKEAPREDLANVANRFGHNPNSLKQVKTLTHDLNDGVLPLETSETFDLIVSQCSIRYIKQKDVLIEEIVRRLKVGGCALIQVDLLSILNEKNEEISIETLLNSHKGIHCTYSAKNKYLFIKKRQDTSFTLGLRLDEDRSWMRPWSPLEKNYHDVGWTSVYKAKP